jgi:hypothetical protein
MGLHLVEDKREVVLVRGEDPVTGEAAQTLSVLVQLAFHDEWRGKGRHNAEDAPRSGRQTRYKQVTARPHDRVQPHRTPRYLAHHLPRDSDILAWNNERYYSAVKGIVDAK